MGKQSAGILLYRRRQNQIEAFLVHPGGPFWAKKDQGAWTLPKGEFTPEEDALAAARREFQEETGLSIDGDFLDLGSIRQAGGKVVFAWAVEGDIDPEKLVSNTCEIEWPPRSGKRMEIPEIDRGAWFSLSEARTRILSSQIPFLDILARQLDGIGKSGSL